MMGDSPLLNKILLLQWGTTTTLYKGFLWLPNLIYCFISAFKGYMSWYLQSVDFSKNQLSNLSKILPSNDQTLFYKSFIVHPLQIIKLQWAQLWMKFHSLILWVTILPKTYLCFVKFIILNCINVFKRKVMKLQTSTLTKILINKWFLIWNSNFCL